MPRKPKPKPARKPWRRKDHKDNPDELLAIINSKEVRQGRQVFRPEYVEQARKLYKKAWTDLAVADFFGVTEQTVQNWIAACPEFARVRKDAKEIADREVEISMFKRATGYNQPVEKIFCKDGVVTRVNTTEHIPASVSAATLWLTNRQPEKWRTRQEITGANGEPLHPAELAAPKRPMIEIARRIVYMMQRATDETNGGPQPLLIEEKITATEG